MKRLDQQIGRELFGVDPQAYDRFRPSYPPGEKALAEIVNEMPALPIATELFKNADIKGEDLPKKISYFVGRLRRAA